MCSKVNSRRILVVGAGLSGAVVARELADKGYQITVIDKRNHLAGNVFDYVNEHGIRVHKYGPHLFHTKNQNVFEWLSRFTDWIPYKHKVKAMLDDGRLVTLPVNKETTGDNKFALTTDALNGAADAIRPKFTDYFSKRESEGVEGKDWRWVVNEANEYMGEITKEDGYWISLDERGRPYPCVEYEYDEYGFDTYTWLGDKLLTLDIWFYFFKIRTKSKIKGWWNKHIAKQIHEDKEGF